MIHYTDQLHLRLRHDQAAELGELVSNLPLSEVERLRSGEATKTRSTQPKRLARVNLLHLVIREAIDQYLRRKRHGVEDSNLR